MEKISEMVQDPQDDKSSEMSETERLIMIESEREYKE
jgi:hypothetical protein